MLFLELLLGVGVAAACLAGVRAAFPAAERVTWALGLLAAALVYVVLALLDDRSSELAVEATGALIFGGLAALGVLRSAGFLAAGWAVHAVWDVAIPLAIDTAFVPEWYPPVCIGFDVAVGAYWLARVREQPTRATV
jgi:hypothetical protein